MMASLPAESGEGSVVMKALTPTDLPEPVVPATSRCGMRARSTTSGSPLIDLPSATGSAAVLDL